MSSPIPPNPAADIATIKRAAAGRWPEILPALAGIPAELLDSRHHPCPKCGGTDRFRLIDADAGAVYCNNCFSSGNGDGIAAIQHYAGVEFPDALRMLADHLGISRVYGNGKAYTTNGHAKRSPKKPVDEATLRKNIRPISAGSHDTLMQMYCTAKPPITPEGIRKCGGTVSNWGGYRCLEFDGHQTIGDPAVTAIVLVCVEGIMFPEVGSLGERKTHTVGKSVNSWISSSDVVTAETILDIEGITDLLAVTSVGLPDGWAAVTNTAGAKSRGALSRPWAAGKKVIVAGDADEPGENGKRRSAAAYHQAGASEVLDAQLPYPIEKDHGRDIRDWLNEGHSVADLPNVTVTAEDAAKLSERLSHSSDKPFIIVTTDEEAVANEAIKALSARTDVFQRGGILAHVVREQKPPHGIVRPKGAPRIIGLSRATLRERMASSAIWARPGENDEPKPCHVPEWTVKAVDSRGTWLDIRQLEAVSETPLYRADGTILQTPGYDAASGILYEPATEFPAVPDHPSPDDAKQSINQLREVWVDVPFASDTDLAVVIALTLTPLARHAFRGPAPLFAIESNTRGAGKTLTADASGIISTGRPLARASAPNDNEEARKLITSVVLAGERMILLDNIGEMFGWPALDAALTGTTWSDRILGANRMLIDAPLTTVWVVTGNNMMFRADVVRRTLLCRLESLEECPEERSGFRHPDLIGWVTANRGRLVSNALTILRGHHIAGRPPMGLKPMGSYEGWSAAVRSAVVWSGLPDPAGSRRELAQRADQDAIGLERLIEGWSEIDPGGAGLTVAEAVKNLDADPKAYAILRSAITELVPTRSGKPPSIRSIGMKMHHLHRRVIGGRYLDKRPDKLGAIWFVRAIDTGGTNGTRGTISLPSQVRAHAHARENPTLGESSPTTSASPTDPNDCLHDWVDTEGGDGMIKRTCRICGKFYGNVRNK